MPAALGLPAMMTSMASVQLTANLRTFFPDLGAQVAVEGSTVADVVREVDKIAPGFAFYVCDELGRLRRHVNIFVEQERVLDRQKLTDPVDASTRVFIVQALSGG